MAKIRPSQDALADLASGGPVMGVSHVPSIELGFLPGYSAIVEPEHGTTKMYRRGCRCELCRAANAAEYRALMERYRAEGGRGEHGTVYRYKTGCRCDECRAANTENHRKLMERYRAEGGRGEHGTVFRYATGCRCRACTTANSRASRNSQKRKESGQSSTQSSTGSPAQYRPAEGNS